MKKSIIAFGILFSVIVNTANANVEPIKRNIRLTESGTKNISPLTLAVAQNDFTTVKRFLELGANIEVKDRTMGMTPLMYAARYNNISLLKLLVASGAKVNETSKMGFNALKYAEISNATDAISYLEAL